MLNSLLRISHPTAEVEAEDIFSSSLGFIFTDDTQNQHGNPGATISYRSRFGELKFVTADPEGEDERRKFAHYLWNAGILMGELVAGPEKRDEWKTGVDGRYEDWEQWVQGQWWLSAKEEQHWKVEGETVLELGAGVGLAGTVSSLSGAKEVTISDYPAPTILKTLNRNVIANVPESMRSQVSVQGHQWGVLDTPFALRHANYYTRILAADCFWMQHEHNNLARSMLHFLSNSPTARVLVIAGFHTGRRNMAPFLVETVPEEGLEVEEIWEMDINGQRREWEADKVEESIGERKKWLVIARLKRRGCQVNGF